MNQSFDILTNKLKEKNIRLSHQRLKVLEYMYNNRVHPTVDRIYTDLHNEIPTLSKTTIYNTLNILMDANLVKPLNIENNEVRYDFMSDNHGHFKCESCGEIFDFDIDFNSLVTKKLGNFKVVEKDIYFKGICPMCIGKNK
jgi:Fur family transcriptional regulator, peroxide stress response regulator